MINGMSSLPTAWPIFVQSLGLGRPVRKTVPSTRASLARIRWASSALPISSEKNNTGCCTTWATCTAMPSANALFPMAGRAPTMFSVPGCNPSKIRSRSVNPVGAPLITSLLLKRSSNLSIAFLMSKSTRSELSPTWLSETSKILLSASSIALSTSSGSLYAISAMSEAALISRRSLAVSRTILA